MRRLLMVAVVAVSLVAGPGAAGAPESGQGASRGRNREHCVAPSGRDLNEFYGSDERIIAPFCTDARTGEWWTTSAGWFMADTFEAVPASFVPEGSTPLEDFLAKFTALKYVVDPGTAQERTYLFTNVTDIAIREIDGGLPIVNTVTMSKLQPLRAGEHVVETSWVFDGLHCDGLGDVPEENCIPAGEFLYHRLTFNVAPR